MVLHQQIKDNQNQKFQNIQSNLPPFLDYLSFIYFQRTFSNWLALTLLSTFCSLSTVYFLSVFYEGSGDEGLLIFLFKNWLNLFSSGSSLLFYTVFLTLEDVASTFFFSLQINLLLYNQLILSHVFQINLLISAQLAKGSLFLILVYYISQNYLKALELQPAQPSQLNHSFISKSKVWLKVPVKSTVLLFTLFSSRSNEFISIKFLIYYSFNVSCSTSTAAAVSSFFTTFFFGLLTPLKTLFLYLVFLGYIPLVCLISFI